MQTRREMLKKSLFGAITAGASVEIANASNEHILGTIGKEAKYRSPKHGGSSAVTMCFGDVYGSYTFPMRPKGAVATDGDLIKFIWPSDRGDARGYIEFESKKDVIPELIVFRLRMQQPEAPYYLHWHRREYFLYTAPGSLIKRASYLMQKSDPDSTLQALSDIRQAVILNLTQIGDGQKWIDMLSDLDREIRRSPDEMLPQYWNDYKFILSETRV